MFEGVGIPLGQFEFGSRALTRRAAPGTGRPDSRNKLFDIVWKFRVNRFRGTWISEIPCPLPEHYVLGFDEQKIETEGIPDNWAKASSRIDQACAKRADRKRRLSRPAPTTSPESSGPANPMGKPLAATRST